MKTLEDYGRVTNLYIEQPVLVRKSEIINRIAKIYGIAYEKPAVKRLYELYIKEFLSGIQTDGLFQPAECPKNRDNTFLKRDKRQY